MAGSDESVKLSPAVTEALVGQSPRRKHAGGQPQGGVKGKKNLLAVAA